MDAQGNVECLDTWLLLDGSQGTNEKHFCFRQQKRAPHSPEGMGSVKGNIQKMFFP